MCAGGFELNTRMKTFAEYSIPDADSLTDLLTEDVSPAVAKTAALAIIFKISQLSRTLQNADSKTLSKQMFWLGSLMALALHTNDASRKF
jgi:hypothetical protein